MSITQPLIADRAMTSSLPQPEIGFAFLKFESQFCPPSEVLSEQNKGQIGIGFKPKLALLSGREIPPNGPTRAFDLRMSHRKRAHTEIHAASDARRRLLVSAPDDRLLCRGRL